MDESSEFNDTITNTTRSHHLHHPDHPDHPFRPGPHFASVPNEAISLLTAYSGLIISLWIIILFIIKRWVLEVFVLPKYYKRIYLDMNDANRRGFLVHHVSAGVKVVLLFVGIKPFCNVVFGKSTLNDRFVKSHARPTMGDILLVLSQLFVALYIFELLVRKAPSAIASAHHIGAIVIAQSAIVLSLQLGSERNATMEYLLCLVWGAFDVLSELWLNIAFILYRIYPNNHGLLAYVFGGTGIISITGTFAETILIMTLFAQSWNKWSLSFQVATPILHVLFTIAQFHAARILFHMWAKQKQLLLRRDDQLGPDQSKGNEDCEAGFKSHIRENNSSYAVETRPGTTLAPDLTCSAYSSSEPAQERNKKSVMNVIDKIFLGKARSSEATKKA